MTGVLSTNMVKPLWPCHIHSKETAFDLVEKVLTSLTLCMAEKMSTDVSVLSWDTESRHAHVSGTKAPNVSPEEKLVACSILTVSVLPLTSILAALWCPWKKPLMTR